MNGWSTIIMASGERRSATSNRATPRPGWHLRRKFRMVKTKTKLQFWKTEQTNKKPNDYEAPVTNDESIWPKSSTSSVSVCWNNHTAYIRKMKEACIPFNRVSCALVSRLFRRQMRATDDIEIRSITEANARLYHRMLPVYLCVCFVWDAVSENAES